MFDKIKDPVFIKEVRESEKYALLRKRYKEHCERTIKAEPLNCKFSKFRLFAEKGERNLYEYAFNQHVDTLTLHAMNTIIYGDEHLSSLEDALYDVLSIYVWALPAHIPDINEENYYELDLASTAVGSTLATIDYLLGDKLHPQLKKRIDTELRRRILEPFKHKIWHWEDRYNNWTSVCAGHTAVTLMLKYPEEFETLLPRFSENMRKFIAGFSDDGVCYEGAGYWGYGLSSFVMYAMLLKEYTKGKIDYFTDKKVKDICCFFEKVTLYPDIITCYGDTGVDIKVNEFLMHSLKRIYPDDIWIPQQSRMNLPSNQLAQILLYIENYDNTVTSDELKNAEYYMGHAGWYTKRTDSYSFAARGGWNGDSHNHNDVGSFIFAKDNRQILCDMGTRYYTKDYFEMPKRYTYLETSSRGHNCPIINGQYQVNLPRHSVTSFENGILSVDFGGIYGIDELKKLVRHFSSTDTSIAVRDEFEIEGEWSYTERFISYAEPKIINGVIEIDGVYIKFDPSKGEASYTTEMHYTKNLDDTVNETLIYLTDIKVKTYGSFEFTIDTVK
ncbi:MAG: heparinase II/III family protein [Clostridia bacterium]|nr:heparinase II/III family protein [Clostridia bacterium]